MTQLNTKGKSQEKWKTIIDFTKIKKGGIEIKKLLKILKGRNIKKIIKNNKHGK